MVAGHAATLHDWLVDQTVQHEGVVVWEQIWEDEGLAERQSESASTVPSYLKHWTVRDCVPSFPRTQVAVRDWVHPPQPAEHVPQREYDQVAVSPEHAHHAPEDHEFATHDEPFQEYPELHALAVLDSEPLVTTVPFEQEKVC